MNTALHDVIIVLVLVLVLDPFLLLLQHVVFDFENELEDDDEYEKTPLQIHQPVWME